MCEQLNHYGKADLAWHATRIKSGNMLLSKSTESTPHASAQSDQFGILL